MMGSRSLRRAAALAMVLVGISSVTLAQAPTPEAGMLAEAKRLTAAGKFDEARALYEQLADERPGEGLVALARFLHLTGDTARLEALLARVEAPDFAEDSIVRARTLMAGGRGEQARALLAGVDPGKRPVEATLLLATLWRDAGDLEARDRTLAEALAAPAPPQGKRLLLEALVTPHQHALGVDAELLLVALGAGVDSEQMDLERATKRIDGYLISQLARPDFAAFKATWLAKAPRLGGGALWVAARLLVREERLAEAAALLEPSLDAARSSPSWPLVAEQYATLLVSLRRVDDAEAWMAEAAKAGSFVASIEAARLKLAEGDRTAANALLAGVDIGGLDYVQRGLLFSVRLDAEAAARDYEAVADVYAQATANASAEEYDHFHKIIFARLVETSQHNELERRLRARFAADPQTPPTLWRLTAEAASQARRTPNAIEALYQAVQARPDDVPALEALARTIKPVVLVLKDAPKDKLMVPESEVAQLGTLARTSLEALVRAQPFVPEHYRDLLAVYEALGVEQPAQAAIDVVARDSTNARVKGAAAFALAINGQAAAALPLYDEALAMAPDNMDLKMNRASCLTRLDRWDEATEFYRSVVLKGYNGRPYHVHELVSRLWSIDQHLKREEAGIAWFREALNQVTWRDELLRDVGTLMTNMGRPAEAEEFLTLLVRTGAELRFRNTAYEGLARVYFEQKRPDDAARILLDGAAANTSNPDVRRSFLVLRAEILGRGGKLDEALPALRELVAEVPTAADAMFDAAEIADGLDDKPMASTLYAEFLSLPHGSAAKRRSAEERLKAGATTPS